MFLSDENCLTSSLIDFSSGLFCAILVVILPLPSAGNFVQMEHFFMFTVEYCGYHTHNPHYDIIDRPSGSSSYLFLLVLSPMVFTFPGLPEEKALPGACILYAPGYPQYYQAEREFFNSYVHFFAPTELVDKYQIPENCLFIPKIRRTFTGS